MPFVNSMRGVHGAQSGVGGARKDYELVTGGTITTSGDYRIHTFTTSGTFYTPYRLDETLEELQILWVGGGGTGASPQGSGGGGGGRVTYSNTGTLINSGSYPITIGGSATATTGFGTSAAAGNNGANGTSGAGGPSGLTINGTLTPRTGASGSNYGGGGAGANANGSTYNGGAGYPSSITGTSVIYAGGGSGGGASIPGGSAHAPVVNYYPNGTGGVGGGGRSPDNPASSNGLANRGGGGSGAGPGRPQGSGGSGVVIVRYKYK
jgi:hypothetical protein